MKYLATSLAVLLILPGVALAQDECVEGGNQNTRSAEVEFSLAAGRNDTRPKEERYARAIDKLEPNWEMEEVPSKSYLLAAQAYLGLRDLVGADSMLTKLVEIAPGCAEQVGALRFGSWVTQYNAGIEAMQAGDEDLALERFNSANMINRDARSLAYAGSIHHTRGETEEAAELYEAALEIGGQDEIIRTASINLASIRKDSGDNAGALEIYSTYSTDNPDDILGRLNYAIALMDADRQPEAEPIFTELLGRDDLSFSQWSQVGIGLYRAQNFAQAAVAFGKAHELNPYNKEVHENLANSFYQGDHYEELMPLAQQLVDRYPLERVNYNLLANAKRELGSPEDALTILQARDELTIEILRSQLTPTGETTYSIDGQFMNRTAPAGSEVQLSMVFIGEDGSDVLTEPLTLMVPAESEAAAFSLQVESETPIAGFRYEAPSS
jgi:tetratricopeptide (TPR) repeat protein